MRGHSLEDESLSANEVASIRCATRSATARFRDAERRLELQSSVADLRCAQWAAVSRITNEHRRLYATLTVRFAADGGLRSTHAVIERVRKIGGSSKPLIRFAIGVGLHDDGSPHNACLVLDVPACSSNGVRLPDREGRIVAEVVALSAFDINAYTSATPRRKQCLGIIGGNFTRTWLALAVSLSRGLGCTHLVLEDAANVRRGDDGALQLLSELTLIECGKTFYEKFGFTACAAPPLPTAIRALHTKSFSSLSPSVVAELDASLPTDLVYPTAKVCDVYRSLRDLERGGAIDESSVHRVVHAIYADAVSSHEESTNPWELVREYELAVDGDEGGEAPLHSVLQLESFTILGDDAGTDLEFLSKHDVDKLDVVLSSGRDMFV